MREYGIPAVAEVAPSATLADVVFERADREPQAVMMRRQADGGGPPWRDVTTAQFRAEVTALAKGLIAAGIGTGDRVALLSRTRYEWTLADYAIWSAGAVSVPIYETSSAEQVEWILTDSGARALIAETPAHIEAIAEVLGRLPAVQRIWLIEGAASGDTAAAKPLDSLDEEGSSVSDETLAGRPPTWPRSSTPPGPRAAPRDASSPTRTCSPTCATQSAPCRRSSPRPGVRLCCSCRWRTRSRASSRSAAWSRAPSWDTPRMWPTSWPTWAASSRPSSWPSRGCSRRFTTRTNSRPR